MTRQINKKFVVITGVTKGLGRAMVDRFSELGWLIAGCGRSAGQIEEMRNQFSEEHDFQKIDVSDAEAVAERKFLIVMVHLTCLSIMLPSSIKTHRCGLSLPKSLHLS